MTACITSNFIMTYFLASDEFPPLNTIVLVSLVEMINTYFGIIFFSFVYRLFKQGFQFFCSYLLICRKKGFYLFTFSVLYPFCIVCVPFWKDSNFVNIFQIFVSNQLQFMWDAHARACMHIHTYIHTHTHTSTAKLCCAVKTVMLKSLPLV